jgi:hypothetical protein
MVPFRHTEESSGPKGLPPWQVGDVVGVLVAAGAVSFYVNGKCVAPNAFHTEADRLRFAVGFGGRCESKVVGTLRIVP